MSSFMVEVLNTRKPLLHTVTRLCAIIGGIFSVLGLVDKVVFKLERLLGGGLKKN